jgi:hypothetical protein
MDRWRAIKPEGRELVKNTVLQTLSGASAEVRKIAALAVAKLAFLEMEPTASGAPTAWPTLLPNLVGMLGAEAAPVGVRASCAQTIGFVMEALDEHDDSPLDNDAVGKTLEAILAAAGHAAPEMQLEAMGALKHSLVFLTTFFTDTVDPVYKSYRDRAVQACLALGGSAATAAATRAAALDALVRMAEFFYANLGPYIGTLAPFTAQLAAGADEALASRALDFWFEIADAEADLLAEASDADADAADRAAAAAKNQRIVATNVKVLTDLVGHVLITAPAAEDDEDEVPNLLGTAHAMLGRVAAAAGGAGVILPHLLPFAQEHFTSPAANRRDAAVMALAVIQGSVAADGAVPPAARSGGASTQLNALAPINAQLVPMCLSRLTGAGAGAGAAAVPREPSATVRESICFYLGQVAEAHLVHAAATPAALRALVEGLQAALAQEPKVCKQAAIALHNVFYAAGGEGGDADPAPTLFTEGAAAPRTAFAGLPLYNLLVALVGRVGAPATPVDVARECMECAEEVLRVCCRGAADDVDIALNLAKSVLPSLAAPVATAGRDAETVAGEKAKQDLFLNLIYTTIQVAGDLVDVAPSAAAPAPAALKAGLATMLRDLTGVLCGAVDRGLTSAFIVLEAMYHSIAAPDAQAAMLEFVGPRLLPVLTRTGETESMSYAMPFAGTILSSLGAATPPAMLNAFLTTALTVLSDPAVDRSLKPLALQDLLFNFLHAPKEFILPHLHLVLPLVLGASLVACTVRSAARAARGRRAAKAPSRNSPFTPFPPPPLPRRPAAERRGRGHGRLCALAAHVRRARVGGLCADARGARGQAQQRGRGRGGAGLLFACGAAGQGGRRRGHLQAAGLVGDRVAGGL